MVVTSNWWGLFALSLTSVFGDLLDRTELGQPVASRIASTGALVTSSPWAILLGLLVIGFAPASSIGYRSDIGLI